MRWPKLIFSTLLLASTICLAADDVRILPLRGPIGTAKISPADGSSTAYRMDFRGQKAICFRSITDVDVYLSSASSIGLDGFPLLSAGDTICYDLQGGTTVYLYGDGASSDIRATFTK